MDEAGRLARGVDEQHAALEQRVVGHDADGTAGQPGEPDGELAGPQRVDLEKRPLVDQAAQIPAPVVALGPRGARAHSAWISKKAPSSTRPRRYRRMS